MKKRSTKISFQLFVFITLLGTLSLVKAQPTSPNQTGLSGVGIDRENLPSSTQLIFTRADDGRVITDMKFESQVKIDGTVGLVFKRCWFRSNGGISAIRDKYADNPRNTTFEDCDFGAHGYDQWASSANIINMSGTNHFRRCLIYNSADGIKFENMSVNYLEDCWLQPILRGDKHTDCSQLNDNHVAEIYCTRCTFEKRTWTFNGVVAHSQEELSHPNATLAETTDWGNACLQTKPCGSGGCSEIIPGAYYSFENCIFTGGNYIITAEHQPGRFVNNIMIRGTSHTASSSLRDVDNFDAISGNIFHDDGAPFTSGNLGNDSNPTPIAFLNIVGLNNDTEAPTVPGVPVASNITENSVDLTWAASTDNVGVTGYKVYINGTTPENVTGTSATISGLSASTQYVFTVSSIDVAGNESDQSPALTLTTTSGSSGTTGLITVIAITSSNNDPVDEAEVMDGDLDTRWASDGDGKWIAFEFDATYTLDAINIAFYKGDERSAYFDIQVSDDGSTWTTIFNGTSSGTTVDFELFDLPNTQASHLRYLGHGNSTSTWNAITEIEIYGTMPDTEAPSVPTGLADSNISTTSVDLSWDASSDNVAVAGYKVYTDAANPITVTNTTVTISGLSPSTGYSFSVSAIDSAGNESDQCPAIIVTTLAEIDLVQVIAITASSDDGNVAANAMDGDYGTRWSASGDGEWISFQLDGTYTIDAIGLAFYNGDIRSALFDIQVSDDGSNWTTIYNGTAIGTTLSMEMFDLPDTEASYLRYLGHGNTSNLWNSITEAIISGTAIDTQAPSVPTGLAASNITTTSVDLSWDASSDNVAVTGYKVYTNGANPVTVTGTTTTVSGLSPSTGYSFSVSAIDEEGNESAQSSALSVTTGTESNDDLIQVVNITSSNNDPADEAEVMDGDLATRWASDGDGKWIAFEFNGPYTVDAIDIAFYKGDERSAYFDIQVSDDGNTWTTIYNGTSSGTTVDFELFDLPNTEASYLRYLGHGNSTSTWNAITELVIYGTMEITSTGSWQNFPGSAQTGSFTVEYDAVPNGNNVDALTGIQNGNASVYDDVACIVRFNSSGQIDARNGGSYSSTNTINYSQGTNYHFRLEIDVPSHIYSVYVTPEGQSEITVASGFAFRTPQQSVTELNSWSLYAYVPSHTVSNMTFQTSSAKSANKVYQSKELNPQLLVYPNPIDGNQCSIVLNNFTKDEKVVLNIFDMSGRIVYQTQISISLKREYLLDISNQSLINKGLYILSAESQSVRKQVKMIIK